MTSFLNAIPCTWRGVPIQVYSYTLKEEPQTKMHMGAFWSAPYVEDLGQAPVEIKIAGFLDPSFDFLERPILEAMILAPGSGILTVPDRGVITAHCMTATFTENISNIIEVNIEFVQVQNSLGLLGSLISGSLPSNIGDAIVQVQTDIANDLAKAVTTAPNPAAGLF